MTWESILSELETLLPGLKDGSDTCAVLDALSSLPGILAKLRTSRSGIPDSDVAQLRRRQEAVLLDLRASLYSLESQLQSRKIALGSELQELVRQQEWVRASRQVT